MSVEFYEKEIVFAVINYFTIAWFGSVRRGMRRAPFKPIVAAGMLI